MNMKTNEIFKYFSITLVNLWLTLFVISGLAIVFIISLLQKNSDSLLVMEFTLKNYLNLLDPIYLKVFARSGGMASLTTFICFLIGYPCAYFLLQLPGLWKPLVRILLIIPFWTNSLIRSYAIIGILKAHGLLNHLLISLGIISRPLPLLFNNLAVLIGLVYNLLPFMIFPIYARLERLNPQLIHAARDLGANPWVILRRIVIPLSLPGITAGCLLVFLPAMTLFYIPDLLGGADSMLLGNLIQFQFSGASNWPGGAATSIMLTLFLIIFIFINQITTSRTELVL